MKRQIRRGCFETNSSSTHAICIAKEGYTKRDFIEFEFDDFGWEVDTHTSVHSKASYLITAIFDSDKDYADEKLQQLKDILDDNHIEYVIPEPKVDSWTYGGETRYYYNIDGYIDHVGGTREFVEAVLSDSDRLMRYLFGDSMVITGNDNSDGYSDRMYVNEGEEVTRWGTYTRYGDLKPEFDNYEIYEKGN
jgi:hypothetical protein